MKFEWDESKNQLNIKKHNVSFKEAETVFDDINAVYDYDKSHSENEDRFIIIGESEGLGNKLTVCHCYRGKDDEFIRIISARRATKGEIQIYEEGLH